MKSNLITNDFCSERKKSEMDWKTTADRYFKRKKKKKRKRGAAFENDNPRRQQQCRALVGVPEEGNSSSCCKFNVRGDLLSFKFSSTLLYIYSSVFVIILSIASSQIYTYSPLTTPSQVIITAASNNNERRHFGHENLGPPQEIHRTNSDIHSANCRRGHRNTSSLRNNTNTNQQHTIINQSRHYESQQNKNNRLNKMMSSPASASREEANNRRNHRRMELAEPCQDCLVALPLPLRPVNALAKPANGFLIPVSQRRAPKSSAMLLVAAKANANANSNAHEINQKIRSGSADTSRAAKEDSYGNDQNYDSQDDNGEQPNKHEQDNEDTRPLSGPQSDEHCPMTGLLTVCERISSYPGDEILHKLDRAKELLKQSYFNIDSLFSDEREHSNEPFENDNEHFPLNKQPTPMNVVAPKGVVLIQQDPPPIKPAGGENSSSYSSFDKNSNLNSDSNSSENANGNENEYDKARSGPSKAHQDHYGVTNRAYNKQQADEFVDLVEKRAIRLDHGDGLEQKTRKSQQLDSVDRKQELTAGEGGRWRRNNGEPLDRGSDNERLNINQSQGQEELELFISPSANINKINNNLVSAEGQLLLVPPRVAGGQAAFPQPPYVADAAAAANNNKHVVADASHRAALLLASGQQSQQRARREQKAEIGNRQTDARAPKMTLKSHGHQGGGGLSAHSEVPKIPGPSEIVETAKAYAMRRRRHIRTDANRLRRSRRQVSEGAKELEQLMEAPEGDPKEGPSLSAGEAPSLDSSLADDDTDTNLEDSERAARQRRQEGSGDEEPPAPGGNDEVARGGAVNRSSTTANGNNNGGEEAGANTDSIDEQSVEGTNQIEPACRAKSIYISPRAALNDKKQWKYVVNAPERNPQVRQVIRVDICQDPFGPCSSQLTIPFGFTSQCKQKYSKKKLLALDNQSGLLEVDTFFIPTCCVCQLVRDRFVSDSFVDRTRRRAPTLVEETETGTNIENEHQPAEEEPIRDDSLWSPTRSAAAPHKHQQHHLKSNSNSDSTPTTGQLGYSTKSTFMPEPEAGGVGELESAAPLEELHFKSEQVQSNSSAGNENENEQNGAARWRS